MATKLPKIQITPPIKARTCISLIELLVKTKIDPKIVPIKLRHKVKKYTFIIFTNFPIKV